MDESLELRPGRFSDRLVAYLLDTIPFTVGAVASVWVWGGPLARPVTNQAMLEIGAAWLGQCAPQFLQTSILVALYNANRHLS